MAGDSRSNGRSGRRQKLDGVMLTPGAGSGRDHHTLVALEAALAPVPVARVDFPYRRAGRRAPDRQPVLLQCVRDEAAAFARERVLKPRNIVLGGRSMGGRMCSIAVAEGTPAAGLVLISYPLHPPGKPEKLRTEHFPAITVPCLFVSGDRDAFGTPEELESATPAITGPVTHVWIERGSHALDRADDKIAVAVLAWRRATFT
ncbi:MAG TPA: alpha/beta family hydrolase [Acidimicrobiales bacterium]|nr:alpha/beta family hydrolase [Acidimicrobiales bacterium]